jgi:hypothetical protein
MAAGGSDLNPRPPVKGRTPVAPATGVGHKPLSSADHAASIPGPGGSSQPGGRFTATGARKRSR